MKNAFEKFRRGTTTMGERIEEIENLIWPVMILCPEPGFKPSFFKNYGLDELTLETAGIEKYFWILKRYRKQFENDTSMPKIFQNMSFVFGKDWSIHFSQYM